MSQIKILLLSLLVISAGILVSSQPNCAFEINPIDKTVTVNDTNIELHCQKASSLDSSIWEVFLNNGTFWTVTGADVEIHLSRGYEYVPSTGSLRILKVQDYHAGVYRCRATRVIGGTCTYYSDNATLTVQDHNCAFETSPIDKTVTVNDTNIELHCQKASSLDSSIWEVFLNNGTFWTVTGADVEIHLSRGYEYVPSTGSLRILKVQDYHAGVYRCRATRVIGGTCTYYSDNATLTVQNCAFEISPVDKTVTVNDINIELHCQKASSLDFSIWEVFLNNGTLWTVTGADVEIHLSRGYEYVPSTGSLRILKVQDYHAGVYRCRATRVIGGTCTYYSDNATLTVQDHNCAFETSPIDKTVTVNDTNIELHCQKASSLDFSIWEVFLNNGTLWTVTGADVEIHLSRGYEYVPSTGSLRILKVQDYHAGVYRCKATRIIGGTCTYYSDNATLTVQNCAFEISPIDKTVTVNDTNIELHCQKASSLDSSIWEVSLNNGTFWTVTGADTEIHLSRGYEYVRSTESLRILKVQDYHTGVYRCRATRIIGGTCTYYSNNATLTARTLINSCP